MNPRDTLASLSSRKALSGSSEKVYYAMLAKFFRWLETRRIEPPHASASAAEIFINELGVSQSTMRKYAVLIHDSWDACGMGDNMKGLTLKFLEPARRPPPAFVGSLDIEKLASAMLADSNDQESRSRSGSRPAKDWKHARDQAMVAVCVGAGLKAMEVNMIEYSDIRWSDELCFITVPEYNGKPQRVAPVSPSMTIFIRLWLDEWKRIDIPSFAAFPGTLMGDPIDTSSVWRRIRGVITGAGLDAKHLGPAMLRHSFAVHQLSSEKSPEDLMEWMGYARRSSVENYERLVLPKKENWAA